MTGTFAAIVLMIVIMAVVGYVLTRLAEPMKPSVEQNKPITNASSRQQHPTEQASNSSDGVINTLSAVEATQTGKDVQSTISSDALLIEEVNRRLPQTQCAQCGHPGCRPYATAIINDNAPINQCPPGGDALIEELATLLGTDALPLDSDKGQTKPSQVAVIVEADCIGCVLCIAACPVDAIVGASKYMHTVIADQCTGCELCIPPCPVDCIELHAVEMPLHRWQWPKPS